VPHQTPSVTALLSRLSSFDLTLDATTHLPLSLSFATHADDNALFDIPVEIAFSNYQIMNGVVIPTHIQRFLNGTQILDVTITSAKVNQGLSDSTFIQQ
jgi:hypothetical protein